MKRRIWPPRRQRPGALARSLPVPGRGHAHHRALRPPARPSSPRPSCRPVPVHPPGQRRRARPGHPRPLGHRKPAPSRRHGPGRDACRIRCNPGVFAGLRHRSQPAAGQWPDQHRSGPHRNALCLDLVLSYAGVRGTVNGLPRPRIRTPAMPPPSASTSAGGSRRSSAVAIAASASKRSS